MRKNKILTVLLIAMLMMVAVLSIVACDTNEQAAYTVTFDSNGGSDIQAQIVEDGKLVIKPEDPVREGFVFLGWYFNEDRYGFNTTINADIILIAHWQKETPVITHTVTFDTDGGSEINPQIVEDGKLVTKPEDPAKEGYNFTYWYYGALRYDFSAPVTEDITLTAEWDEKIFEVKFDTDGGSEGENRMVAYGSTVECPVAPTKADSFFAGWYVGGDKYDFSSPITGELTITAHWVSTDEFTSALAADYSNFTSIAEYTEGDIAYSNTYMQTDRLAFWSQDVGYEDHLVVFSDNGSVLAMYYLNDEEWVRSNLSSYADFVVALFLDEISLTDVEYVDGLYRVVPESVGSVVYALFRSTESYDELYIEISDGHISAIIGALGEITHVQTFTDFGTTVIEMPAIPAVSVQIKTDNREIEAGKPIDADELIKYMFSVKAENKEFTITPEMVSFGDLNFANPAEGEYTVTLSFETWDGALHSETAKIVVQSYGKNETFAEMFAKDYSNVTMSLTTVATSTSQSTIKLIDNVYRTNPLDAFFFVEADGTLTKYQMTSGAYKETRNNWYALPRLDMLFALNSALFEQVDSSDTYTAKNADEILPVIQKALSGKNYIIDKTQDFSITLSISLGRVSRILIECSYKMTASATRTTAFSMSCILSDYGTTEIEIPQIIQDMRNASTAQQFAYIDVKKYEL